MEWVEGYQIPDTEIFFEGAWCYENDRQVILLNKTGHIILLDKECYNLVIRKKISEDLAFKFLQRGFAHLSELSSNTYRDDYEVSPQFFMIDFTNRCNMACAYCLRECDRERSEPKIIDRGMLRTIADSLAHYCQKYDIGHLMIQPWGGEPLLEKEKIFYLQDELIQREVNADFLVETNGLLLNDKTIEELAARNIFVSVSMDGNQTVQNFQRKLLGGGHSYKLVSEAVNRLKKTEGEHTPVLATITSYSACKIEDIIEFFAVEQGIKRIKLNFVHPSSFVDNSELCLTTDEISECTERIFNKVLELMDRGYVIYESNICTKLANLVLNNKTDACLCRGCNGGRKMLTIDCRGDVYPCDVTDYPEERLGNLNDNRDFIQMVEDALDTTPYFKKKRDVKCDTCPWYYYCRGGCTVHVKCAGKPAGSIDDIECSTNITLYPLLVKLILEEPDKVNTLLEQQVLESK